MKGQPVCLLAELEEGRPRGFTLPGEPPLELILLRRDGRVLAYRNRCPHTGIGLEWLPDRFLDPSGRYLQCATHGALFRPEDGYCLRGPCAGDALEALPVRVAEGRVLYQG